jgi:hypothetical protein
MRIRFLDVTDEAQVNHYRNAKNLTWQTIPQRARNLPSAFQVRLQDQFYANGYSNRVKF